MSSSYPKPASYDADDSAQFVSGSVPPTTLRGRDPWIDTILDLLGDGGARLVSLTGPGGVGKTRLSLEIAQRVPTLFVQLAGVTDPADVLAEIATVADITVDPSLDPATRIASELSANGVLLVLDNLEQIPDVAPIVASLLRADANLRILVTSRTRLRLSGEHEVSVLPLEWPEASQASVATIAACSATQLFVDRTRAANPRFTLTDANAGTIAEICRRLDGLPLAIELAAARGRFLSPDAILARLERRLELLVGGPRDLPERQQTMRSAIAWSYDLLSKQEAALFRRLGVFAGGFTIDEAEALSVPGGDVLERVGRLSEHGLVLASVDRNGDPRLGLLETVREYALDQLIAHGEEIETRDLHARVFLELAKLIGPKLQSSVTEQTRWWNRAFADIANFRSALEWLESRGQFDDALGLITGLDWFWTESTFVAEAVRRTTHLLDVGGDRITGRTRAHTHSFLAMTAELGGENALADWHAELAIQAWEAEGDTKQLAIALHHRANTAYDRSDHPTVLDLAARGLTLAEAIGDHWYIAACHLLLGGSIRAHVGDLQLAARHTEQSVAEFRLAGETVRINGAITSVGLLNILLGDLGKAYDSYQAALDIEASLDSDRVYAQSIFAGLGTIAVLAGDDRIGVQLRSAAEAAGPLPSMQMRPSARVLIDAHFEEARRRLGEPVYAAMWAKGFALDFHGAAELARSVPRPGTTTLSAELQKLSKRELEIVDLLAEGLTDQEISDRLFISRRTASQHVSAILRKLEVSSRAAAVAIATRSRK